MKLSTILNLKQNNSLKHEFILRIVFITILFTFFLIAALLYLYQNNKKREIQSRREVIQKIISANLLASARFGDIIYGRADSIELGKEIGLTDIGICIKNKDLFERINDPRCKPNRDQSIEKSKIKLTLDSNEFEIEFSWKKDDHSVIKNFFLSLLISLTISLLIVFPTFYYLLNKFHSKVQGIILTLLKRHHQASELDSEKNKNEVPLEFKDLDLIIAKANNDLKKATSEKVHYELSKKVSHDIRSPLKVINEISKKLTLNSNDELAIFNHAISRINSISEDLLKDRKQQFYHKSNYSIENILENLRQIIKEKQFEFKVKNLALTLTECHIDKNQIIEMDISIFFRIISNLINNAEESIRNNHDCNQLINLTIKSLEDYLLIQVSDNGPGFSEETLSQILNREISISTKGGNGIGLSSALSYMKDQGGYLDIISEPLKGAKVNLFFIAKPNMKNFENNTETYYDFIFIDDEQINHLLWKRKAKQNNLNGIYFNSVNDFLLIDMKNKNTIIYLDYILENADGLYEAERLSQAGFSNIFLCTNYQFNDLILPYYIKGIVKKDFTPMKL